jgi:hypothetical protein
MVIQKPQHRLFATIVKVSRRPDNDPTKTCLEINWNLDVRYETEGPASEAVQRKRCPRSVYDKPVLFLGTERRILETGNPSHEGCLNIRVE